ncbi:galanin peptides-like isoform X3 [Lacerta agilis]|uniref:galanin peptides-like isoform X3 n=1 Tax=Lacerta agilis TaxID=80427 RepID=UPI001419F9BD|nr:galanin peptides-like isoform X3 [Lacerta agilis]
MGWRTRAATGGKSVRRRTSGSTSQNKMMWRSQSVLCASLLLCGLLGECCGTVLVPKDKRGWTLNSAGYLLGHPLLPLHSPLPKADAHQTLSNKGSLAHKRDATEDLYSIGQDSLAHAVRSLDDGTFQTLMDFLTYLNPQDQRAVSRLPFLLSEEESLRQ